MRGAETKARIVRAFTSLVWPASYMAVSVDAICQKAGVRKGSFYHFFSTKGDVAIAAVEVYSAAYFAQLDQVFSARLQPWERFEALCRYLISVQEEKTSQFGRVVGCMLSTMVCEVTASDEGLRKVLLGVEGKLLRYYQRAVRDGVESGDFDVDDVDCCAAAAFSMMEGAILRIRLENNLDALHNLRPGFRALFGVQQAITSR